MKSNKGIALIHLIIIICLISLILFGAVVYTILGGSVKISSSGLRTKKYSQQFFAEKIRPYKKEKNAKITLKLSQVNMTMYCKNNKCLTLVNAAGENMKTYVNLDDNSAIFYLDNYKYASKTTIDEIQTEQDEAKYMMFDDNIFIQPLKEENNSNYKFTYIGKELINDKKTLNFQMEITDNGNKFKDIMGSMIDNDSKIVMKYWLDSKKYTIVKLLYGFERNGQFVQCGNLEVEIGIVTDSQVEQPSLDGYQIIK